MAKLTVLELVQKIMSRMDSDEVEAYDESIESLQVSEILEDTYFELMARRSWEFLKHQVRQLDAGTNVVELAIPSDVRKVELVRYKNFTTGRMTDLRYVSPMEFLDRQLALDTTQSNIDSVTVNDGVTIGVMNDRVPTEWTSFDEENIIFNAYDVANEASGVTVGSSVILAEYIPTWTMSDSFIPDLPERMFPLLLNEALSVASLDIKQEANQKAEQNARRHYIRMKNLEAQVKRDQEEANYGRQTHNNRIGLYQRR